MDRRSNPFRIELGVAALFLLALTLVALGPVLFGGADRVLSNEDADLAMQFVHWRAFGFGEMRAGHLPLWNPHVFCGAPFFGGFQSALLYPPNWLYVVLPLARAINIGIALHVFLAGFFMYLWARERSLRPPACALAGVLFMFSGPYFAHISGGHLPNLCAMAWGPLIFLAIDRWLERRNAGAVLLGGGAVALQILAGHPQYVFYTGIAAGLYCLLALPFTAKPWHAAAGLALIPLVAAALGAVQLLEGFHAAGESLRSRGVGFAFASLFSFPPENFLTWIAPGFFGGVAENSYWSAWTFCETSLFFGVTGLVFAIYGGFRIVGRPARLPGMAPCPGNRAGRPTIRNHGGLHLLGVVFVLFLLALGAHTPLFYWLYRHVPGFNKFRGLAKFIYPAVLFLVMLAAIGFDALLASGAPGIALIAGTAAAAVVLTLLGWRLLPGAGPGFVGQWMQTLYATGDVFLPRELVAGAAFQINAARHAADSLFLAAGTLLGLSLVLLAGRRWRAAPVAVLVVACAEMLLFAQSTIQTFSLAGAQNSPAADYLADHPAPAATRILNLENPDLAMSIGQDDLWGYDAGVVRRYAEWIADTQGVDPAGLNEELRFTRHPPLYGSLLGCRYVFPRESLPAGGTGELPVFTYPVASLGPRLSIVTGVRVVAGRNAIFAALREPAFDPRQTVILETPPEPAPVPGEGAAGTAKLLAETSDTLTIEAELSRPAILVIADTFCSGWTIRRLASAGEHGSGGQSAYRIQPADYCLRGIALAAGRHRLQLAYRPVAFVAGAWISSAALVAYLLAGAAVWRGRFVRRSSG
jgi:hypothetical protein